jgi:hypothetical protein
VNGPRCPLPNDAPKDRLRQAARCTPPYGERWTGLIHEATGKPQYPPVIEFERRDTRDALSEAVWRAVLDRYPMALEKAEAVP